MRPSRTLRRPAILALVAGLAAGACESRSPTPPDGLRFGQVGSVSISVETPIQLGLGYLSQSITWGSTGRWEYDEAISYAGVLGDANTRTIGINPEVAAGLYAQWVTQVNDIPGAQLFVPELDPTLDPTCRSDEAIVRLVIRDDARNETTSWKRCAIGPLELLDPASARPDPAASRVLAAVGQVRAFTVEVEDAAFRSAYRGTVPFATLDRGEVSRTEIVAPRVFTDADEFAAFWSQHATGTLPSVAFPDEIVIVAALGQRSEAGTTVEIRRILPVETGTFVEAVEQVPGDFCSPAGLRRTPFHIVVTPAVPEPIRFSEIRVERIPCG